jgi:hypothetical protein
MATFPTADVPLLLLPVRLETRFRGEELWIRIFPDDVHISDHDAELTGEELDAGTRYLDRAAEGDRDAALSELQMAVGVHRAAWVQRQLAGYGEWIARGRQGAAPVPATRATGSVPRARLLPERFVARGYLGIELVFEVEGAPVREPLAIVPTAPAGDLPFDEATAWLHDFDVALARGMALKVPLGPRAGHILERGLTRLLVYGVRPEPPDAGAAGLAELIDAHRWAGGAAFVPPGTPTNHTPTTSAGAGLDERSVEAGENRTTRMARALGLDVPALAMARGDVDDEGATRTIHELLWPATWGYFLPQWMGVADDALLGWLRRHFIDHVRAAGPLPAWRFGRQPYGVLPVMAPGPGGSDPSERTLSDLLAKLRAGPFARAQARVPRVLGATDEAQLTQIFLRPAQTERFRARPLYGRTYLKNLYQLVRPAPPAPRTEKLATVDLGLPEFRQYQILDVSPPLPVTGDPSVTGWLDAQEQRALAQLGLFGFSWKPRLAGAIYGDQSRALDAAATEDPFLTARPGRLAELRVARPRSFTGKLLRHAGLLVAARAGHRALGSRFEDVDLLGFDDAATPAPWTRSIGGQTVEQFLDAQRGSGPAGGEWPEWWRLFDQVLPFIPAARRDALVHGVLDLASHRLDAWLTSLATRRLFELRAQRRRGLCVGAFGWVEDLRPGPEPSSGFVHAPSLGHAATAAVLAAGYRAHQDQGPDNPLAIDLSSARVRRALWVLRASLGKPLAAVLGEQVERQILDAGLGDHLPRLRQLALLEGSTERAPRLDGLALARKVQDASPPGALATDPRLQSVLDALVDTLDAITDLVLAESVHQWVEGQVDRTGQHLASFEQGQAATAQSFDVVRTPRRAGLLTHRVVALRPAPPEVRLPERHLRSHASAVLEAWAAELFGPLDAVPIVVRYLGDRGELLDEAHRTLGDAGLGALDLVFGATHGGVAIPAELERCLRYVFHRDRPLELSHAADVALHAPEGGLGLPAFLQGVEAMWRLLTTGRPLVAADLAWPPPGPGPESPAMAALASELGERLERLAGTLRAAAEARVPTGAGERQALAEMLLDAWLAGVAGAVQAPTATDEELRAQAGLAAEELGLRLGRAASLADADERIAVLVGNGFRVLPALELDAATRRALAKSRFHTPDERSAAAGWIRRAGRVRPSLDALGDALLCSEALTGQIARFEALQRPRGPDEPWVGTALPHSGGQLSVVACLPAALDWPDAHAGLLLDEWIEELPARDQVTGVTFHHAGPRAAPPQTMLLAVPPASLAQWSSDALAAVLIETLELARLRAVAFEDLGEAQHYLPAVTLAHHPADDTVETVATDLFRG